MYSPNVQKILVFDPGKARATVSSFFYSTILPETDAHVTIFLIGEIRNEQHQKNQQILKELQDVFVRVLLACSPPITESVFEEILHSINKRFPAMIDGTHEDFLQELSLVAGIITNNAIHFAQVGTGTILYIQNGKLTELSDHALRAPVNPLKIFKEISSGKIEEDDILFVCTDNFLDYFSQEKIKRLLEENIKGSIAAGFEEFLLQAPLSASFAALSISVNHKMPSTVDQFIAHKQHAQGLSSSNNKSMEQLIEREEITDSILSPKFAPTVKRKSIEWWYGLKNIIKKYILRKPSRVSPVILERHEQEKQRSYMYKRKHQSGARSFTSRMSGLFKKGITSAKTMTEQAVTRIKITPEKPLLELGPDVGSRPKPKQPFNLFLWFQKLSMKRKLIAISIIIITAVFAQSIVFAGIRDEQQKRQDEKSAQEAIINDAISEIDAAILYGDNNRIQDALASLQSLQQSMDESRNKELYQQVGDAITSAEIKLERVVEVTDINELIALGELVKNNKIIGLSQLGSILLALDPASSRIIRIDADTGESKLLPLGDAIPQFIATSDNTAYILAQDFSLFKLTESGTTAAGVSFGGDKQTLNVAAMASYLGRLYLADISQNQILRASQFSGGLGTPGPWLDESIDMTDASALTIDGTIYLGYKNGTIRKFLQGKEQAFTLTGLKDPMTNLSQLWTNENTTNIYALDSGSNRVLVYNKNNGSLVEQMRFTTLSNITAFSVNEDATRIFLLSETTIYRASLIK